MTAYSEQLRASMAETAKGTIIPVSIAGWGQVFVRAPTVAEVDAASQLKGDGPVESKRRFARGACNMICDESGTRIFDFANESDVDFLALQPWDMLQRVVDATSDKSGVDAEGN